MTEIYSLTVLETRSLKSRCRQGHVVLKAVGENVFLAFLLTSGVTGNARCSLAWHGITPVSASIMVFSLYFSVCTWPFLLCDFFLFLLGY